MSREIKFRAWNIKHKYMQDFNSHKSGIEYARGSFMVNSGYDGYDSPTYDENTEKDWDIMQYTGLQDKNGVELYEGDLVLVKGVRVCEIIFHQFAGCWDLELRNAISSEPIGAVSPASYQYHAEVIGNIHENPELLETK